MKSSDHSQTASDRLEHSTGVSSPTTRDRRGRRRGVATTGFRPNDPPPNKGHRLPAEVVSRADVERLMEGGKSRTGVIDTRDRAIVWLMYRMDLSAKQIASLARRHYDQDRRCLTVPGNTRSPDKTVDLDDSSCELLDGWLQARRDLRTSALTPLFCTADGETRHERPVEPVLIRAMVKRRAIRAGIERRVTTKGLQMSGREQARGRGFTVGYVDEDIVYTRYPDAYACWRNGLELFQAGPERHATHIGLACRDAMIRFACELARRSGLELDTKPSWTVDRIRAALRPYSVDAGGKVAAFADALLVYWGCVSDLVQRQVHGRENDNLLTKADAERVLYQTLIVMYELDRLTTGQVSIAGSPQRIGFE